MIDLLGAEAAVAIGRADLLGQLEHLARTDGLTGLPNRRHWEQQLPRELARAWRDGRRLCVAMLDLDYFKDYNDRQGHQAGDRLLREAAVAWRVALRPYDMLARYGGEEFSVILPGCELDDALTLVERLRTCTPQGESCSAGIAEWDGEERRRDAGRAGRRRPLPGQARRAQPLDRRHQDLTLRPLSRRVARALRAPAGRNRPRRCPPPRCAPSPACSSRRCCPACRAPCASEAADLRAVREPACPDAGGPGAARPGRRGLLGGAVRRRRARARRGAQVRPRGWGSPACSRPRSPWPTATPRAPPRAGRSWPCPPRRLASAIAASTRRT